MNKNAPRLLAKVLRAEWAWLGIAFACLILLAIGLTGDGSAKPLIDPTRHGAANPVDIDFQRVSSQTPFDPAFLPFVDYGGMGIASWVTLWRSGRPVYLHLSTLRLHATAPDGAEQASRSMIPKDQADRVLTAEDVRALWSSRKVSGAFLDFDDASRNLQQSLGEAGRLPVGARARVLTQDVYAEVSAAAGGREILVLRRQTDGAEITLEEPVPTSAEPLFHDVFMACIYAERMLPLPWSLEVLGHRYRSDKRCGLMSSAGKWLVQPEFQFMESEYGSGHYVGSGPYLLMLRGDEPCVATSTVPIKLACLGKPISSLTKQDYLPFRGVTSGDPRRAGDAIGFVSAAGAWAIPPRFREAQTFSGKVTSVLEGGTPAVIDRRGKWITPPVPDDPTAATWLAMRRNGRVDGAGVINRSGDMVIPFLYGSVERLSENRMKVCHHACSIVVLEPASDPKLVKPLSVTASPPLVEAAAHWVATGENGRWGFQDADGHWMIAPQFDDAEPFDAGLAKVKLNGFWGLMLSTGQWLHEAKYEWISPLVNGVAVAQEAYERQVLLRADGQRLPVPDGAAVLGEFGTDGLALARRLADREIGYLNRDGEWSISPRFSAAQSFLQGYAIVNGSPPDDWRPANLQEPPYILRSVHWLSPDIMVLRAVVGKEDRVGLMDRDGNWLIPTK